MVDLFLYLIDKVDEPKKTTGPSGVIPIAVLKEESNVEIYYSLVHQCD